VGIFILFDIGVSLWYYLTYPYMHEFLVLFSTINLLYLWFVYFDNKFMQGCTATVLLVWTDRDDNFYAQCANVGDSECIMRYVYLPSWNA